MIIVPDLFGVDHEIVPCTEQDIEVHFNLIKDVIPSEEVIQFQQRMSECILAGSAYTLSNSNCFLYYLNYKPCCAKGIALYGKESPMDIITLFIGVFTLIDTKTFKLGFGLHAGKLVKEYKSLITLTSLKRQRIPGHPLVIRIDELKKKLTKLYRVRGL